MQGFRPIAAATAGLVSLIAGLAFAASAGAAPLVVTKTADTADGQCNADCSLREAIGVANLDPHGPDTIKLKAKTYKLTIAGPEEDGNAQGDLDVLDDLTIKGAGAGATTIKGAWADPDPPDRLLDVPSNPGVAELAVSGLTLTGGSHIAGAVNASSQDETLKLTGVRVAANESPSTAGAIYIGGQATISKTVFSRNHADTGAPFVSQGSVDLTNVTFDHNTGGNFAGAMLDDGISSELRNVTFSNNTSADTAGAMLSNTTDTQLANVTFSGNHADGDGGAFYIEGGTTVMNNVTVTDNETDGDGGGLYINGGGITLNNSIVAGNHDLSDDVSAPDCAGFPWSSDGYVLLGTDLGCDHTDPVPGFRVGPPKLKPLADNGGFTKTHALKAASPAKNAGNPAAPGSTPEACATKDQRGIKRPQQGRCDMGAYELK